MVRVTNDAGKRAHPSNTTKTTMHYKVERFLTGGTAFLKSLSAHTKHACFGREKAPPQQSTKHSHLATITDRDSFYTYPHILTMD
jgi:hypothetical protein